MSYNVYRVASVGFPRDHHSIFVETQDDQSGWIFEVVGNIQNGMIHRDTEAKKPELSVTFQEKVLIGKIVAANFHQIKPICESVPAPKKQFDGAQRICPEEPSRRCQEWTKEAINALHNAGIFEIKV